MHCAGLDGFQQSTDSVSATPPPTDVLLKRRRPNTWTELSMDGIYQHYKYYHFYAVCFGLGWCITLYRPFCSLVVPSVTAVFFTLAFEAVGLACDMPAHTKKCRGPPYERRDAYWGFWSAVFVAILNSNLYYVYTLSYGCGIIVFALRGAKRKWSSLREIRKKEKRARGRRW